MRRQRQRHPVRRRWAMTAWAAAVAATGSPAGRGADRFSGGSGTDTATDFAAAEGDTTDGTIP